MEDRPVLIMVTTRGRDDAERLGEGLVEAHLAAGCSVVPTVRSFYYSDAQLMREHEALLLIKTVETLSHEVQDYIRANHSSELPEIIEVAIQGGNPAYLQWVTDQTKAPKTDPAVNT